MTHSKSNSSGPLPEIVDVLKLHELVQFFYGIVGLLASSSMISPVERRQLRQAGLVVQRAKRRRPVCSLEITFEGSFDDELVIGRSCDHDHVLSDGMVCDGNNYWFSKKTVGTLNCTNNRDPLNIIVQNIPKSVSTATRTLWTTTVMSTASPTTTSTGSEWARSTTSSRSIRTAARHRPSGDSGARRSCRRFERRAPALTRG